MRLGFHALNLGRNLFCRRKVERELSDEVASYLELLVAANLRDGLSESEARRAALLEVGGVEQVKEQVREAQMGYRLETLLQDLRYAGRFFLKHRFFGASSVLTLALGFGISTAMFCVGKTVWFTPLNYPDADKLFQISTDTSVRGLHEADVSFPRFEQIRSRKDLFAEAAALTTEQLTFGQGGDAEQITAARVSDGFFRILGTDPLRGRLFWSQDHRTDAARVAVLSFAYWQTRFGGNPNIIGQRVSLGGAPSTIVGIVPRTFAVPFGNFAIYLPRISDVSFLAPSQIDRGAGFLKVLVRPQPGISIDQMRSELRETDRRYRNRVGGNMDAGSASRVSSLRETVVRDIRPVFNALTAAVVCIMILASINVANLSLGQLARREKEIAIRHALGADHSRIIRLFLSENILLTIAALVVGIAIAWAILATVQKLGFHFLLDGEVRLGLAGICFAFCAGFRERAVLRGGFGPAYPSRSDWRTVAPRRRPKPECSSFQPAAQISARRSNHIVAIACHRGCIVDRELASCPQR